jgi:predicted Zn-dependent protease
MIKKISILIIAIAFSLNTFAQDKKQGIKFYRYEKYQSAIKQLEPLAAEDKTANYYLGLSYLALEDVAKAKAIFQKYATHPANMSGIARVLFIEKKDAEAKAMLESIIRKTSRKNKSAYMYAANAITYTNGGDLNKAITWYDYYLDWRNSAKVLIHKGDALRRMQKGGPAMTAYQTAYKMDGYQSLSSYKQGNLWYASKTYDSALVNYQRAADADPENPLPYYDLSMAYYKINKYDRAKKEIENYLKYSDNSPEDQMQYANILYLSKDYDGAISKMENLLSSGNGKSYMYRVLGYSYKEKGKMAEATKNMDLLFQKHPKDKLIPDDYLVRGEILLASSDKKAADAYFIKYINNQPDETSDQSVSSKSDYDVFKSIKIGDQISSLNRAFGKGTLSTKGEQGVEVRTYKVGEGIVSATITNGRINAISQVGLSKTVSSKPSSDKISSMRKIAELYKDSNDWAGAAKWYQKITETNSPDKEVLDYWWAGRSYFQVSDYVNSKKMYEGMIAESPEEPIGHYWLARVAAAQDPDYKTGGAVDLFKKYLPMVEGNEEKKDKIVTAKTYLSVVAYNKKKFAEAKKYSSELMQLDPGNSTAKQILAGVAALKK